MALRSSWVKTGQYMRESIGEFKAVEQDKLNSEGRKVGKVGLVGEPIESAPESVRCQPATSQADDIQYPQDFTIVGAALN